MVGPGHPDLVVLVRCADGEAAGAGVAAHVRGCRRCGALCTVLREEGRWFRAALALDRADVRLLAAAGRPARVEALARHGTGARRAAGRSPTQGPHLPDSV